MNQLKVFAGFFLFSFILSVLIGLLLGVGSRESTAMAETFGRIHYVHRGYADASFVHRCDQLVTHEFLLDSREILNKLHVLQTPSDPLAPLLQHKDYLIALVGGTSGGLSITGVTKILKDRQRISNKVARIGGALIGIISGYSLGYYLGATSNIPCDSELVVKTLNKTEFWDKAARLYFLGQFIDAFELKQDYRSLSIREMIEKREQDILGPTRDIVFKCNLSALRDIESLERQAEYLSSQIRSSDFESLRRLKYNYDKIRANPEYSVFKSSLSQESTSMVLGRSTGRKSFSEKDGIFEGGLTMSEKLQEACNSLRVALQ